jgi:RNA polymerase sigma-70 factor (ECF subfamily)
LDQLKNLIEDLLRDSQQAMRRVFDLFYKPLCVYAARYVQSVPVAEEVVSDVMFKIWQNRHQGFRVETFSDYLYAATRNTALNYLKQMKNQQKKISDDWADSLREELIEETPLDNMIAEETQLKINNLIDTLPEQCRNVFIMSRYDNMSYEEIAAEMDISVNTVKYHVKTALQKLRAEMSDLILLLIMLLTFFWIIFLNTPTLLSFLVVLMIAPNIPYS